MILVMICKCLETNIQKMSQKLQAAANVTISTNVINANGKAEEGAENKDKNSEDANRGAKTGSKDNERLNRVQKRKMTMTRIQLMWLRRAHKRQTYVVMLMRMKKMQMVRLRMAQQRKKM